MKDSHNVANVSHRVSRVHHENFYHTPFSHGGEECNENMNQKVYIIYVSLVFFSLLKIFLPGVHCCDVKIGEVVVVLIIPVSVAVVCC